MSTSPVTLKYAESDNFAPGGGVTGVNNTLVAAKVQNLAFAKDVALHYAQPDGTWAEKPLDWRADFGNYDLFQLKDSSFVTNQFVVRYTVDGQTFWDNNHGANYSISETQPNTVGGHVALNVATARRGTEAGGGFVFTTSWVEGEIYVFNLSFNKRVGIRLTADGWATSQDTDAFYSGPVSVAEGQSQVERWSFKTPEFNLDESTPNFQFAIYYNDADTGQWFWDNNFGQNYILSKEDLSNDQ